MVRTARHGRARGFSLVELLVAGAVGVVILTAAVGYLLHRARANHRDGQAARLKRDASLLLGQLERELRQAGLGRPTRTRRDGNQELLPGPLLFADETALTFVADLPRPDASLNGLSSFAANQAMPPLPAGGVALLNELNGGCDVDSSGFTACQTHQSSLLLTTPGHCGDAPASAPTCPWGLGKYRPGEWLVLVDGRGRWTQRQVHNDLFRTANGRTVLVLDGAPLPMDFFVDMPNRGWVASLDRVHYRLTGGTVERKQCWHALPTPATLPDVMNLCAAVPGEGTDWEPLLSTVPANGLRLRYFDASGAVLGPLPLSADALRRVHRVEVALQLASPAPGGQVTSDTLTAVTLRH